MEDVNQTDLHVLTIEQNISEDYQVLIDGLPLGCRYVFILSVIEGYKHKEIAELLNISEGTSKSQLAYAKRLLKQQIELNR